MKNIVITKDKVNFKEFCEGWHQAMLHRMKVEGKLSAKKIFSKN